MTIPLIVLAIFIALETYAFQLIRTLSGDHWWKWVYLAVSIGVILNVILQFIWHPDRTQMSDSRDFAITLVLAFFVLKLVFFTFMFGVYSKSWFGNGRASFWCYFIRCVAW
jgi:hypothetical protein